MGKKKTKKVTPIDEIDEIDAATWAKIGRWIADRAGEMEADGGYLAEEEGPAFMPALRGLAEHLTDGGTLAVPLPSGKYDQIVKDVSVSTMASASASMLEDLRKRLAGNPTSARLVQVMVNHLKRIARETK